MNEKEIEKNEKLDEKVIKIDNVKKEDSSVKPSQIIQTVKKEEIEKVLKAVNGVAFKFGECIFKVTYTNVGQRRFSATCINEET